MQYEWDETKRKENLLKHGIDFTDAEFFEWQNARVITDDRREYGESRYVATGFIKDRLHVMAFTVRPIAIRIISLRKANKREVRDYEETTDR